MQTAATLVLHLALGLFLAASVFSYRVHQMRICIQSVDPSRLPSQCIYCKTRLFPLTVRLCTANTYLPARMTLNEAYCLTTTCRRQLPRMPPEPYSASGTGGTSGNPTVLTNAEEGASFNTNMNANGEPAEEAFEEAESLAQQPTKVRPPAKFFLGKPHKVQNSLRPSLFG